MRYNGKSVIKRKCGKCGETFYINKDSINEAVYYDKKTYHIKCFEEISDKRAKSKDIRVYPKWRWVSENMSTVKKESYVHLKTAVYKEEIYDFIKDAYDLTVIPTTVWQKISDIYAGTFKGMTEGIPPEYLLDMWKRKIKMLNGIAEKNSAKGREMSPYNRLNYDLAVLVNKYDSYLKWLEKQKIIQAEMTSEDNENIVRKYIGQNITENNEEAEREDITDLIDDIFG